MRITHILYSGLGGHASVFFSLVKGDAKKEFSSSALFCGIEKIKNDYVEQCRTLNVPYDHILKKRGADFRAYGAIYKGLKKLKPDILFLHGASFILPAIIFKLFNRHAKLIIRDTQAIHLKSTTEWLWLRIALYFSDNLIFLTKESLEGVLNKTGYKKILVKGVIISNGLDTNFYSPVLQRPPSGRIVFGMQSRLQSIKDHPTLLHAFVLLKKRYPVLNMFLRIAGEGETMASLQQLKRELGIDTEVDFCGMLAEKDLLNFMHSLDIYVHASHGETMSNSIMQAMSCGLPIIASNVWGINNMITDGDNGLLYRAGDAHDLCEKMACLIDLKDRRVLLAQKARAYAVKEFSLQQLFCRYRQVFS